MNNPGKDAEDNLPKFHPPERPPGAPAELPAEATRGARYASAATDGRKTPDVHRGGNGHVEAELLAPTLRWLARMPTHVRPALLMNQYPRVVNLLWALRRQPERFGEYMDELLFYEAARGKRAGFPADAVRELLVLRQYYDELTPNERDR